MPSPFGYMPVSVWSGPTWLDLCGCVRQPGVAVGTSKIQLQRPVGPKVFRACGGPLGGCPPPDPHARGHKKLKKSISSTARSSRPDADLRTTPHTVVPRTGVGPFLPVTCFGGGTLAGLLACRACARTRLLSRVGIPSSRHGACSVVLGFLR